MNTPELVDAQALSERKKICEGCPNFIPKAGFFYGKCKVCGCPLGTRIRLAKQQCPISLWKRV